MGPIAQIKEGDAAGGVAAVGAVLASTPGAGRLGAGGGGVGATEDDDLTSLTWLQDRNLLRGMKLTPPMGEAQESPTSDYGDEGDMDDLDDEFDDEEDEDEDVMGSAGGGRARTGTGSRARTATARAMQTGGGGGGSSLSSLSSSSSNATVSSGSSDSGGSSANASPAPLPTRAPPPANATASAPNTAAAGRHKHPLNVPYDPLVHVTSKPPYSFSCLIFMAIEDSSQRALPVKEIYLWILEHFPYFKNAPTGWKNSVRHNLSLNKCFRKVEKAPNLGKGSLWMVDPMFRPNLLAALQKAPFHPQSNLERIAAITNSTLNGGGSAAASRTAANGGGGGGGAVAGGGATSGGLPETPAGRRLPDPELFPFLSRRLAASGVDIVPVAEESGGGGGGGGGAGAAALEEAESLDDVDAAAAMLALKHGPLMLITRNDVFRPFQGENGVDSKFKKKIRASKTPESNEGMFPVITTSPSEDHTYSAGPTVPPSSSPDEAYGEGSASEDSSLHSFHPPPPKMFIGDSPLVLRCTPRSSLADTDAEEQRKIAEGADALLNLAGITTRKRSHSDDYHTIMTAAAAPVAPVSSPSPSSSSSTVSSPLPPSPDEHEVEHEEPERSPSPPPPPPPRRRAIATRGRKRGGVVHANGTASAAGRPKLLWSAASGAGRKRRGGRRRGAASNPGLVHKARVGSARGDPESRRTIRSEEKTPRSRR